MLNSNSSIDYVATAIYILTYIHTLYQLTKNVIVLHPLKKNPGLFYKDFQSILI